MIDSQDRIFAETMLRVTFPHLRWEEPITIALRDDAGEVIEERFTCKLCALHLNEGEDSTDPKFMRRLMRAGLVYKLPEQVKKHLRKVHDGPPKIEVVEDENDPKLKENQAVYICKLWPPLHDDDLTDLCTRCSRRIVMRPHAPKFLAFVCTECWELERKEKEHEEIIFVMTRKVYAEIKLAGERHFHQLTGETQH